MRRIRGEHHVVSSREDMRSASMMKHCRRQQRDARVPMFVIVPIEELGAEPFAVFERTEAIGKARAIFQRLVDRFGVRVIVADVRTAVRLRKAEAIEQ